MVYPTSTSSRWLVLDSTQRLPAVKSVAWCSERGGVTWLSSLFRSFERFWPSFWPFRRPLWRSSRNHTPRGVAGSRGEYSATLPAAAAECKASWLGFPNFLAMRVPACDPNDCWWLVRVALELAGMPAILRHGCRRTAPTVLAGHAFATGGVQHRTIKVGEHGGEPTTAARSMDARTAGEGGRGPPDATARQYRPPAKAVIRDLFPSRAAGMPRSRPRGRTSWGPRWDSAAAAFRDATRT